MNAIIFTWMLGFGFAFGGNLAVAQSPPGKKGKNIDMNDLPGVDRPFKVAPYVRAAALLQKMGKEKACEQLAKLAERGDDGQVAILCRLLFSKKEKMPIRPPRFGDPIYLGGTSADDWPLSPLELVDDVPFFVVDGYNLGGERETSLHYLNFYLENCEWSNIRFDKVSDKTIEKALKNLLASGKWKTPLTDSEREYLSSQIK
jgi:hypothetical protein